MADDRRLTGGCLCGAVRYEIEGEPLMVAICHCTICRPAHAAPAVAWALFQEPQVRFTEGRPTSYASSPESQRGLCPTCGTQISFTASYIPGLIDVSVGSLDRPQDVAPTLQYWDEERLPWAQFADDLPKAPSFCRLQRSDADLRHVGGLAVAERAQILQDEGNRM